MSRASLIQQLIVALLGVIALNRNGNFVTAFAPVRTSVSSSSLSKDDWLEISSKMGTFLVAKKYHVCS